MELAADEVLVQIAEARGYGPGDEEREQLQAALASQLSKIAGRFNLSHRMVTDADFDLDLASESFLRLVLAAQKPVPWLSEFRFVLDPDFPSRVDDQGAETAARLAREFREVDSPSAPAAGPSDDQAIDDDGYAEESGAGEEHGE
jgi:hypothetical protein